MRILVIDSYPDAVETLCDLLEFSGHTTRCARSYAEAITVALEFRPELVISEALLPEGSGFDLCRELRGQLGTLARFACYTVMAQSPVVQQALEAGFDAAFAKPDLHSLLAMIAAEAR